MPDTPRGPGRVQGGTYVLRQTGGYVRRGTEKDPERIHPSGGLRVSHTERRSPHSGLYVGEASPKISSLTKRVSSIESRLSKQIAKSGIRLTGDSPESDVVKDVRFSFEMRATPSARQLIAAVSQVDRVIRVAAGFTACTHPELRIWTGAKPSDLKSLEALLQKNIEAWDLEIEYLGLGSLRLKLKPSGKKIKKVTKKSVVAASLLASLATFTGYTVKAAASSTSQKPRAPHSVVYANGKEIPLPPPRPREVIVQLPPGSKFTETIRLSNGKRIEWKIEVGSGDATIASDGAQ